jgi:hypothetical protein
MLSRNIKSSLKSSRGGFWDVGQASRLPLAEQDAPATSGRRALRAVWQAGRLPYFPIGLAGRLPYVPIKQAGPSPYGTLPYGTTASA